MTDLRALIVHAAHVAGLDWKLVDALVTVESGGNPFAWNPEPHYRYVWDVLRRKPFRTLTAAEVLSERPPDDFPTLAGDTDQEWWGQAASWGLMQIMGAVARERGFLGPYLTELVSPDVNLELGCAHLKLLLAQAHGDEEQACAMYNGGRAGNMVRPFRSAGYAAKVLRRKALLA